MCLLLNVLMCLLLNVAVYPLLRDFCIMKLRIISVLMFCQNKLQSKKKVKANSKRIRKMLEEDKRAKEKEFERAFFREFWPDNVWLMSRPALNIQDYRCLFIQFVQNLLRYQCYFGAFFKQWVFWLEKMLIFVTNWFSMFI